MILSLFGYLLLFMAVYSGRKEDSMIPLFSWKWLLIMFIVILGVHLVIAGHKERELKQKINIEQYYEPNKTQQA